jgi:hypothetical protein
MLQTGLCYCCMAMLWGFFQPIDEWFDVTLILIRVTYNPDALSGVFFVGSLPGSINEFLE